jgi:hypothetical protein
MVQKAKSLMGNKIIPIEFLYSPHGKNGKGFIPFLGATSSANTQGGPGRDVAENEQKV